jgi:hypothetical protein
MRKKKLRNQVCAWNFQINPFRGDYVSCDYGKEWSSGWRNGREKRRKLSVGKSVGEGFLSLLLMSHVRFRTSTGDAHALSITDAMHSEFYFSDFGDMI